MAELTMRRAALIAIVAGLGCGRGAVDRGRDAAASTCRLDLPPRPAARGRARGRRRAWVANGVYTAEIAAADLDQFLAPAE